jgi:hypothetical protein
MFVQIKFIDRKAEVAPFGDFQIPAAPSPTPSDQISIMSAPSTPTRRSARKKVLDPYPVTTSAQTLISKVKVSATKSYDPLFVIFGRFFLFKKY